MTWWDSTYLYKRDVTIAISRSHHNTDYGDETAFKAGHPVLIEIPYSDALDSGRIRSDFEDVEIIYMSDDATPTVIQLGRTVTVDTENDVLKVRFALYTDITDVSTKNYFVYYGNPDATQQASRPAISFDDWPLVVNHDSPYIAYSRPREHWVNGVSETTDARASLTFYGSDLRIIAHKGNSYGIMEVQIDEGPITEVDLYSLTEGESEVYVINDLDISTHKLRIRVSGRKNPVSLSTKVKVSRIEYIRLYNVDVSIETTASTIKWDKSVGG